MTNAAATRRWIAAVSIAAMLTPVAPVDARKGAHSRVAVRAGVSRVRFADKIDLSLAGSPVPGAALKTRPHYTPSVQIGYFLTPRLAVNATLGVPPTIGIDGAGSIAPLGRLGRATYGSASATLQYHPFPEGRVRPYVGAGVAYFVVLDTKDGSLRDLRIGNDPGPVLEAGADLMIGRRWGLFVDVKRAFLQTHATGSYSGLPVSGRIRLDPWVVSSGVVVRF